MGRLVSIVALVLAGAACLPVGAQAAFGINDFDVAFHEADGTPSAQAGSHPFDMATTLGLNVSGEETEGRLRELFLDLPPGLVVNTTSVPRCKEADFEALDEGVNDCSPDTALGVVSTAVGEAGNWSTAPVFNLVAPPGVLMRLGFRVAEAANVIADFELSPDQPYRLLASVGEIPEAIELFAAELQLWGVPASPLHDAFRGRCGVDGVGGTCTTNSPEQPLLTLPTSCDGPLSSFYEALSWGGALDLGGALTHDGAGNPLGLSGCGNLGFDPQVIAQPTTSAANSPTGLDLSIDVHDDGLDSPGDVAQSNTRQIVLVLPAGMSANPAVLEGLAVCSEADLVGEALEEAPGEGCPDASRIGAVEVESPLVEELVTGSVYLGTPYENLANSPVSFYVVVKSPALGVVVKQVVEVEPDPETGQLVAFIEEIPQLPFSHFRLHLDEAGGGPLISPPLCGSYETRAEVTPWADSSPLVTTTAFAIVSGPGAGPCPSAGNPPVEPGVDGPSPLPGAAPVPSGPGPGRLASSRPQGRHCPKGKRKVRRHGKTGCVPKHHRKHKRGRRSQSHRYS